MGWRSAFAELWARLRAAGGSRVEKASRSDFTLALPAVHPDSALRVMGNTNPSLAADMCLAMLDDLGRCLTHCSIENPDTTQLQAFEQIHSLKNAVAPIGSEVLFRACDQLRRAAATAKDRPMHAQQYKAIAEAAILLVERYRKELPSTATDWSINQFSDRTED